MELEISFFIWSVEYPPEWVEVVPDEVPLLAAQEADVQSVDLQHLQHLLAHLLQYDVDDEYTGWVKKKWDLKNNVYN